MPSNDHQALLSYMIASSEIHHCTLGGHYIDGIQEALKGSSEVQKVWYDNSLPYTSREARTMAINVEGHANVGAPPKFKHPQYSDAAARPNADNPTSHYDVPDCPESVYEEEEDLGYAGMAGESLHSSSIGEGAPHAERTPAGDPCSSSFTLDTGDFVGGPVGGGDPVHLGSSGAQVRGGTMGGVDGQLLCLAGHHCVKEFLTSPYSHYSAYNHSEGDCLFDQANPTQD